MTHTFILLLATISHSFTPPLNSASNLITAAICCEEAIEADIGVSNAYIYKSWAKRNNIVVQECMAPQVDKIYKCMVVESDECNAIIDELYRLMTKINSKKI